MATKFLSAEAQYHAGVNVRDESEAVDAKIKQLTLREPVSETSSSEGPGPLAGGFGSGASYAIQNDADAPPCSTCGAIMIRSGACYKCVNCGATSGCA
jgi:ribonucleoside-diphosphate reductase alpha chain